MTIVRRTEDGILNAVMMYKELDIANGQIGSIIGMQNFITFVQMDTLLVFTAIMITVKRIADGKLFVVKPYQAWRTVSGQIGLTIGMPI